MEEERLEGEEGFSGDDVDVIESYGGVEEVDIGDLSQVREERQVIPATRRVRVKIIKTENRFNADNTYRWINLSLRLMRGIEVENENETITKFKGAVVFGRVCYYADPISYDDDFFKKKQHLVQLKYLINATGLTTTKIDGHFIELLIESPEILVDITVRKRKAVIEGEELEITENEVRNYKPLDITEQV